MPQFSLKSESHDPAFGWTSQPSKKEKKRAYDEYMAEEAHKRNLAEQRAREYKADEFASMDASMDGFITQQEQIDFWLKEYPDLDLNDPRVKKQLAERFDNLDLNKDGKVSKREFMKGLQEPPRAHIQQCPTRAPKPSDIGFAVSMGITSPRGRSFARRCYVDSMHLAGTCHNYHVSSSQQQQKNMPWGGFQGVPVGGLNRLPLTGAGMNIVSVTPTTSHASTPSGRMSSMTSYSMR